jgi:hypothetical protein
MSEHECSHPKTSVSRFRNREYRNAMSKQRAGLVAVVSVAALVCACGGNGTTETASSMTTQGWGVPQRVNTETYNMLYPPSNPHIRFTAAGNALAVWTAQEQHGLTDQHAPAFIGQIHSTRYFPGTGWSTERSVDIDAGAAFGPQLEMDADGNGLAIWIELPPPPTLQSLYVNRYSPIDGWGQATPLASDGVLGSDPQLAIDPMGNALTVWTAWGIQPATIEHPPQSYAARYVNGGGWVRSIDNIDNCGQTATAAVYGICGQSGDGLRAYSPEVKFDAAGNAIAVWAETDLYAQTQRIYANRYRASTGTWGIPTALSDDFVDGFVQLGLDGSGNAWAIWPSGGQIRMALYTPATGWGAAQLIAAGTDERPQVASDGKGNALAVWANMTNTEGNLTWALYASQYTLAGGWDNPLRIDCTDSNPADASHACPGGIVDSKITFDTAGNAFVVWSYAEPPQPYQNELFRQGQIYANRYTANKGWDTPQSIDIEAGLASQPDVAVDRHGHALAIWAENGQIYANRFD